MIYSGVWQEGSIIYIRKFGRQGIYDIFGSLVGRRYMIYSGVWQAIYGLIVALVGRLYMIYSVVW